MISLMEIYVGTCGFSRSRKLIYRDLDVVELQQTFYDPPPPESLEKMRKEAPEGFIFTVKAWMLITHQYNPRLWRRIKRKIPGKPENYGFFKNTREIWWAWQETKRAAEILKAEIIVFQSPSSFKPIDVNIERLRAFFSRVTRDVENIVFGWEPRGEWWLDQYRSLLEEFSTKYGVVIIGDFLRGRIPHVFPRKIAYTRLHGLGGREVNYKYRYTDDDLINLKRIIENLDVEKIYVLFNNIYSYEDAVRFKKILGSDK